MRKITLLIFLCIAALALSGCTQMVQVEDLAFVLILGIDTADDGQLQLTVQIPKITGSQGSESGGSGESDSLHFSATGANFIDALTMLEWAVPRRIDLSQIELIAVSEQLAKSGRFDEVAESMMNTARLYAASRMVICEGTAADFVRSTSALIGSNIATELSAMFANYIEKGFIPDVTFADIYYKMHSIYSDPLIIHAKSSETESAAAAAMITPADDRTGDIESEQKTAYLGAAIIHDGSMAGRLNGEQLQYCLLLRGESIPLSFQLDNRMVLLKQSGKPKVSIDTELQPMTIDLQFDFTILPDSEPVKLDGLEKSLSDGIRATIEHCQSLSCEPFELAERATRKFTDFSSWLEFDWTSKFSEAAITIDISLKREDL